MTSKNFFLNFLLWSVVPVFYIYSGQDVSWDLHNYHLYIPVTLFEGSFAKDFAPAGIQSFFNPLLSLPPYFIHRIADSSSLSFLLGLFLASFQGLCGPLIFFISKKLLKASSLISFICSLIGITSSFFLSEAGTSFGDLTLSVLLLFSVLLCCNSLNREFKKKVRNLIFAWGILGASCGIKFISIFILPLIFCLSIASIQNAKEIGNNQKFIKLSRIIIFPTFIGYFVFGLPGFILAWLGTSKPFFPLFSFIFGDSPYFLVDNHGDKRFVARTISDFILAPLKDFNSEKPLRGEIPYKDPRPMISFYFGAVVLTIYFLKNKVYNFYKKKADFNLPSIVWFQIGLFLSYFIWLKVAGIGRYSIPFISLLGISLLISLIIMTNIIKEIPFSELNITNKSGISHKLNIFLMILILSFSLLNTNVPNWGRTDFQTKWNSLKRVDYENGNEKLFNINDEKIITKDKAVVLLDKPMAWLKQYAPNQSFNILRPGEVSPLAIKSVKKNIMSNDLKEFLVIGFEENYNSIFLDSNKFIETANGEFIFSTQKCLDYKTPLGYKYRICEAKLE